MVDILFLAHNRPGFTEASLNALLDNTDIGHMSECGNTLAIYTDHDPNPFYSFRLALTTRSPIWNVNNERHGGPVACLNHFLQRTAPGAITDPDGKLRRPPEATPEFIAKIDNDTIVPPGWLPACLDVMKRYPNVDLLGIEPWTPDKKLFPRAPYPTMPVPENHWKFQPRPVSHIGGIGLFRRSAFERFGRPVPNLTDGRFGFTEWQWSKPLMVKAFIEPPLPVFLLDHLPFGPWADWSDRYEREGIQRNVGWMYDRVKHAKLWDWWLASGEAVTRGAGDVGGPL